MCYFSPVINRLMHVETMTSTHIILDPYVAIYVIAGYLWGYVALHYDIDKAYNVANSTVIAILPRLTVILGDSHLYWTRASYYYGACYLGYGGRYTDKIINKPSYFLYF